jgi:transmembrane sensor
MKPKTPHPPLNSQILEEASDWFVDFRVGDVDGAARERFDEWLRRSPEHIRAYWEIAKTYVELPSSVETGQLDVDGLIAYAHSDGNVVSINAGAPPSKASTTTQPAPRAPRAVRYRVGRRRFAAVAACTLVATLAVALWWRSESYPLYTTEVGERRSLTLVDGSTVDLNARSSIRVDFSDSERRVELLGGQALFQVSKDKARPFIVSSGDATVRAIGTQFDVDRKSSSTTITVLEGRVAVYSNALKALNPDGRGPVPPAGLTDPAGGAAVFLSTGEQVTVTPTAVPAPRHADLATTTAWMQQRRMIFDGTKLADVVGEFNLYNHRQLVIESTELADFRVSGVYSSTDPASLLRFLREQPGIRVIETDAEVGIARQ